MIPCNPEYKGSVIYAIVNIFNNNIYVGSAKSFKVRRQNHINDLRRNVNKCKYLQNAWNKYGESSFEFKIIEYVDVAENLIPREQYWIDNIKPKYNISPTAGSTLGKRHSEETKKKISIKNKGKKHTDEFKRAVSERFRGNRHHFYGRGLPEELRAKISKRAKERATPEWVEFMRKLSVGNKYCVGRTISEETRKKIGDKNRGKKHSDETKALFSRQRSGEGNVNYGKTGSKNHMAKKVNQYDKNGCLVASFDSIVEASQDGKFFGNTIVACCKGKRNSHGGFVWKYVDEESVFKSEELILKRRIKKAQACVNMSKRKSKRVAQMNTNGNVIRVTNC